MAALTVSHPLGSPEVRLLVAWVNAVLDHGEWNAAAQADFETAIRRELARASLTEYRDLAGDQVQKWLDGIFDRAQLTYQERRVIEFAMEGWTAKAIAREIRPLRHRGAETISIEAAERYLRSARRKLLGANPLWYIQRQQDSCA